jgi:AMMECR1 domain-containing protein
MKENEPDTTMTVMKKITKIFFMLTAVCIAVSSYGGGKYDSAYGPALERWDEFSQKPESRKLVNWLRCHALAKLMGTRCPQQLNVDLPPYFGMLGIFITLKKGKKIRGCYGAFSHASANIEELLPDYLRGAMTMDPRYAPIERGELDETDIIISITSPPQPFDDYDSLDLLRYGIAVTCGDGTMSVYVPAEIRDTASISRLIKDKECQFTAFRTVTIR